jgi:adenylate cyclase
MSDAFKPSPELAAITNRWLTSFAQGDGDAVANLLSASPALTYVGSAENETWCGDEVRLGFAAYTQALPRFNPTETTTVAFERGPVGWAHWTATTFAPETGMSAKFRCTFVFSLERGVWRVVHVHNSNPVTNLEALGYEQSNFDDLISAARASRPKIGHTGMASVMFTDIAGSSTIAETVGDDLWAATIQRHLDMATTVIDENGGALVKSLGDGTMSTFPTARAAMMAAQVLQSRTASVTSEPQLRLRIGIHTGDVVQSGDDFFGTVVNKAARVAAVASPDEIRVSDATRIMVGGAHEFAFGDPATVPLKGLEGEHLIYRLDWRTNG